MDEWSTGPFNWLGTELSLFQEDSSDMVLETQSTRFGSIVAFLPTVIFLFAEEIKVFY